MGRALLLVCACVLAIAVGELRFGFVGVGLSALSLKSGGQSTGSFVRKLQQSSWTVRLSVQPTA